MTQTARLIPSDLRYKGGFGASVAMSNDTIAVGTPSSWARHTAPGRTYVFVKPAGGWINDMTETAKLTASDGVNYDMLGSSVSMNNDTIAVGAPHHVRRYGHGLGAAYVYVKPAGGWVNMTETAKLTVPHGRPRYLIGYSVAISDHRLVVGTPAYNFKTWRFKGTSPGAIYLFSKPPDGWESASKANAKLRASDGKPGDGLGGSVACETNPAAILASGGGAVYVFEKLQ